MIKNLFMLSAFACILATSCKEEIPAGIITVKSIVQSDTSYITTTIPTQQPKNILIEEFTGVKCSNCPKGTVDLRVIENANAPRVLVAKIHSNLLATPIGTDQDLRCPDANDLATALGLLAKPSAGVDRILNSSADYTFTINNVGSKVTSQLLKTTPVNINLLKDLNTNKDSISLAATFTFTDTTSRKMAYQIYLLEDDVETKQDSFDAVNLVPFEIEKYIHEKVLRKAITPVFIGTALKDTLQPKGMVYIRSLQFPKPSNVLKIENCLLLVFITDRDTKEIIHCQQIHL